MYKNYSVKLQNSIKIRILQYLISSDQLCLKKKNITDIVDNLLLNVANDLQRLSIEGMCRLYMIIN